MGIIVSDKKLSEADQIGVLKPVIYCCSIADTAKAVSLNRLLAGKLVKYRPKRRTMQIEKCLSQVLSQLPDGVLVKDFDVLFNPGYQIDVLQVLINVCKNKPFSAIWPGKFGENKLYYAEEGYQDYKVYDVANYDITCVV